MPSCLLMHVRTYPLSIRRRHQRPQNGEIIVHLPPAVSLDGNVCHPLNSYFLLVFRAFCPPPFSPPRNHRTLRRENIFRQRIIIVVVVVTLWYWRIRGIIIIIPLIAKIIIIMKSFKIVKITIFVAIIERILLENNSFKSHFSFLFFRKATFLVIVFLSQRFWLVCVKGWWSLVHL